MKKSVFGIGALSATVLLIAGASNVLAADEGGKGTRVLLELVHPWRDSGRLVTADAYFASVEAALKMKEVGLNFIGNVK